MSRVPPPRAAFVDHPVGRTFGPPGDRPRNEQVLAAVLSELGQFTSADPIRDVHCQWSADGSRRWEAELRREILRDR